MLKVIQHKHNIVPATMDHIKYVARNLREADRLEIEALGMTPMQGLAMSFRTSLVSWALIWERPVAVFGVSGDSFFADTLIPWAVTTDDVPRRPVEFMRASQHVMKDYMGAFGHLYNLVDDRHVQSKRWLKRLGFELHEPIPVGPLGMPFRPFEMRRV